MNKELKDRIIKETKKVLPHVINLRHELHKIPEIKFEEFKTAKLIREELNRLNVEILLPMIETDTIALINGRKAGKVVALRADIDGLLIEDASNNSWDSRHDGVSHSCGHDGHIAILLGVIQVLCKLREQFSGTIMCIFQPAEEEVGGGKKMIELGLFDRGQKPDMVFGLHGWPGIPTGTFVTRAGAMMAGADTFKIIIRGKGGHVGKPHHSIDTIIASARLISALKEITSCSIDPLEPAILSICSIHAGSLSNIIPETAVMHGAVRYFDLSVKKSIYEKMMHVIEGICSSIGASYELEYKEGYIPLVNDSNSVRFACDVIKNYLGKHYWKEPAKKTMASEDFAYYLDKIPGVFFKLGLGIEARELHTPEFDFNDRALENGIVGMAALAVEALSNKRRLYDRSD